MQALLLSRDDLRTHSGAGGPHGEKGKRNSPERREDGADDHSLHAGKPGVCGLGASGQAQSPRGAAASKGVRALSLLNHPSCSAWSVIVGSERPRPYEAQTIFMGESHLYKGCFRNEPDPALFC